MSFISSETCVFNYVTNDNLTDKQSCPRGKDYKPIFQIHYNLIFTSVLTLLDSCLHILETPLKSGCENTQPLTTTHTQPNKYNDFVPY